MKIVELPGLWRDMARNNSAKEWISVLFAGWLFVVVLAPDNAYRIYFHGLIYPLTIYVLVRRSAGVDWADPFLRLFLLFCTYSAVTTWFVGAPTIDDDIQASRWGLEAALGMLSFYLWLPSVVTKPECWGRVFLAAAVLGATVGFGVFVTSGSIHSGRLHGLGALENPVQAASTLTAILAIGIFLRTSAQSRWGAGDWLVVGLAVMSVGVFVFLTKSRAPVASFTVYFVFLSLVLLFRRPYLGKVIGPLVAILIVSGVLEMVVGLSTLYEQMLERGASYRFDIWQAYLQHPPESIWLGNGAGADPGAVDAARLYLEPKINFDIAHPHNIWLGAYSATGLIGVGLQLFLLVMVVRGIYFLRSHWREKLQLFGLLGLFVMLTFTDEHTLLVSVRPIWVFGWMLLVFPWFWCRYRDSHLQDTNYV